MSGVALSSTLNPVSPTLLEGFPRARLGHFPTPLEPMPRLSAGYGGVELYVKRDDCTGLGFGGNKVRQLEYYLGHALEQGCDVVLSTGAVQSNYMRTLAAAAARLGLECHVQLENRVENDSVEYQRSGNRMLTALLGARITVYPGTGDDEDAADRALRRRAEELRAAGRRPYVVPLTPTDTPLGALGYAAMAGELLAQVAAEGFEPDLVVVASGSGLTHAGLLFGLRLNGSGLPVLGACVRRDADAQRARILGHCANLSTMLCVPQLVHGEDAWLEDNALAPGYGRASDGVRRAVALAATREGLLTDPVYSGKTLACLFDLLDQDRLDGFRRIIFLHTGGAPALFAYRGEVENYRPEPS